MQPSDHFKRVASVDVPCARCSRTMAIQRFNYTGPSAGLSSIDFKCLSCGHEQMRPYMPENSSH